MFVVLKKLVNGLCELCEILTDKIQRIINDNTKITGFVRPIQYIACNRIYRIASSTYGYLDYLFCTQCIC